MIIIIIVNFISYILTSPSKRQSNRHHLFKVSTACNFWHIQTALSSLPYLPLTFTDAV